MQINRIRDKVFLLSIEDITNSQYGFCSDAREVDTARKRTNTAFVAEKIRMNITGAVGCWWLRSPGDSPITAMGVNDDGFVSRNGIYVDSYFYAVCPALCLNLSSSLWSYAGVVCTDGTGRKVPFEKKMQSVTLKNPKRNKNGTVIYDCVWFGRYPQSDATGAYVEPIKWRVLEVNGGIALLHADQNLDAKPFNKTLQEVTWSNCTLRSWLNGYGSKENICSTDYRIDNFHYRIDNFLNRAFTLAEQEAIIAPL